ncbi:DHS-like NAD/FAD-binding domain-containing protein [Athelia psychrophila]|uniref:DHS-like NAD/FAD-binding domain-containing protein n=1 Tax=Athelia psychrophila TaxID=1759441 RepID=A0A166TCY4_9AGAM|nr:DHS-like NAD/FAD-binding domain-containing protein [Fibularhizoctonia sp. CBS 109695]
MSLKPVVDATNGSAQNANSTEKSRYRREAYASQVQAFINAADEVDIDEETIDDILDGFDGEIDAMEEGGSDVDVESAANASAPAGLDGTESEDEADAESDGAEEDPDAQLEQLSDEEEVRNAWSPQEKRGMSHHLKEHGMASFIAEYAIKRTIPIVKLLLAFDIPLCEELRHKNPKTMIYFLKVILSRELHMREKLTDYNTVADVVNLIRKSQRIVILTGAGISVSCGIPDFRSRDGLYASLKETGEYDLDDPQQMFDIQYFRENPAVPFSAAAKIYPSNFTPSPCHRFIKSMEDKDKLTASHSQNYTQNIDTLETLAGVRRVLQCHGSFATASCIKCFTHVQGSEIEDDILNQRIPLCKACSVKPPKTASARSKKKGKKKKNSWDSGTSSEGDNRPAVPPGIMKARHMHSQFQYIANPSELHLPDITFFGEKLTDSFEKALTEDREKVDLLLVIGTSLNVAPVADVVSYIPHSVPQILINKTPVRHMQPDVMLLGNADAIVQYLCAELGWELPDPPSPGGLPKSPPHLEPPAASTSLKRRTHPSTIARQEPVRVGTRQVHVWLFEGAEGGQWLQKYEESAERDIALGADAADRDNKRPRLQ